MTGKKLNYYAGGNTAKGFYGLFESNMQGLEKIYILKGGPGTGKSSMIKRLADTWANKGYDVELIHCSSDNDSLDGLIIPELKFGIFDGTAPHVLEPKAPGAIEEYVNLGVAWDKESLQGHKEEILDYQKQMGDAFQSAYQAFEKGLLVHDDLEEIYINELDFDKVNQLTDELIDKVVVGKQSVTGTGMARHRFFGATTPRGAVDFVPNVTEGLNKRYFIKGRAGTGKSTLLKKVASAARERNFDLEVYHCGFDPESIDMIIIRELSICLFDSTSPHEYFPEKHGDEIVDVYQKAVTPGTDEKYEAQIAKLTKGYKQRIQEGVAYLQEAKSLHDQLEKIYIASIDFSVVDETYESVNDVIKELEAESN